VAHDLTQNDPRGVRNIERISPAARRGGGQQVLFNSLSWSEGRNSEHPAPSINARINAQKDLTMSNHCEGGKGGGGGGDRGPSSHSGPGGNWPSTNGNPSGGGRGNGPAGGGRDDDGDDE
jgi:hypothetical protein